ncbi:MAG: methanesulfonate monooxygenase [Burkholderiales bacterium]|nr:methanesulfonate monooxygenase [Burkholderiales bacterium]MDE1926884.1 methanesulfonate monooxygenase [Burkholderiales bacterium]MDE2161021.1 methanesulfonate monooxygenase [Burkholderiales bacterium]MDE2505088.1 methanesulfonate monooxygenase [Burkholderiales bacterium]
MDQRHALTELVCRSCMTLDDRKFDAYLELCDPAYRYRITAYSPEIRQEMIWLEHDKPGLKTLFGNLPRHNSDQSPLTRHVTVYIVNQDAAAGRAQVLSALQVFKTALDGGATELYAVGKIHDEIALGADGPRLLNRNIRLETRMLGIGYHIPF